MLPRWTGRVGSGHSSGAFSLLAALGLGLSGCGGNERAPFVDEVHHLPGEGGAGTGESPDVSSAGGDSQNGTGMPGPGADNVLDPGQVYLIGYLNSGADQPPLGLASALDNTKYALTVPSPKSAYVFERTLLYSDKKIWELTADYAGSDAPADVPAPGSPQANDVLPSAQCPKGTTVAGVIAGPDKQLLHSCSDTMTYLNGKPLTVLSAFTFLALGHGDLALGMFDGTLAVYHTETGSTRAVEGNPQVIPLAMRATKTGFMFAWQADALELVEVDDAGTKTVLATYADAPSDITLIPAGSQLDNAGNLYMRARRGGAPDQVVVFFFPKKGNPMEVYNSQVEGQTLLLTEDPKETPLFTGP